MNILGIETSGPKTDIAVRTGEKVYCLPQPSEATHSASIIHDCKTVLDSAGITLQEIDRITVGLGPGSYTGTRIGCAAAKGLAWSLNIDIGGISSFQAIAAQTVEQMKIEGTGLYVIGNAYRDEMFVGKYSVAQTGIGEEYVKVLPVEKALKTFEDTSIAAGPGIALFSELIKKERMDMKLIDIRSASALYIISETLRTAEFGPALTAGIEPVYGKLSEPERNLIKKEKGE